jgi:hypothetical protein
LADPLPQPVALVNNQIVNWSCGARRAMGPGGRGVVNDRRDCLVCGRPVLPSGEPSCQCLTHSLSRPVAPPRHGPDPADVARFPLDVDVNVDVNVSVDVGRHAGGGPAAPGVREEAPAAVAQAPHGSHRKPRHRTRIVVATGGAVAAVVGCTALAASLLGGQGRPAGDVPGDGGASLTLPDGGTRSPSDPDTHTGPDAGSPLVLRKGDEGPHVVELQQRLAQLDGIYDGEPHGRYDKKTWLAVARFQSAFHVFGDSQGVYGPLTRAKLEAHTTKP